MTMTWFTWGKKEEKETLMKRYERIKKEIESYDEDDEQEVKASNDVYCLLNSMLFGDSLIYSFAYLRKLALTEKLDREDLIVTDPQNKEDRLRSFQSRCSKTINAQDVFQFVHANLDRFNDDEELNSDLTVHALLSLSKSNDAYLSTFDDQFDETSLVYGICVNRGLKRITISFRGSVTESNNWNHNLQVGLSEMNTPEKVAKLGFSEEKKIQVHTGFKTYVFQEKYDPENPGKQKYDEIKKDILYLYDEDGCEGYNIYVTGHSLGAAVSTLVAFELAASREVEKRLGENPVVNINFASPYLGGKSFNEAFRCLERAGKIKHIRVSNKDDLVAVSPPLSDYTHVGVNLYLNPGARDGYDLAYRGNRSMWWQWSLSGLARHSLVDYWDRKKKIRAHIGNKKLDDLFDPSITHNFKD